MSIGKRLAKRSIIGTRVCAPGEDGYYYSGVISAVNTPASPQQPELNGLSITPDTRYSVRFDPAAGGSRPPDSKNEYSDRELIGPGFASVTGARLVSGQKVYLTYNGREIQAEVTEHRQQQDEVDVVIALSGQEGTTRLSKRIDEVRLLESRKSARLADSDTDFARLADMGSDRKRSSSHSIEVPQVIGSRKRRPSSSNDSERSYNGSTEKSDNLSDTKEEEEEEGNMDECSAAMVLMSLSTPPKNPLPLHCLQQYGSWDGVTNGNNHHQMVTSSLANEGPTSNSSSSSASWRSSTPSPPLSDEGPNGCWANNGTTSGVPQPALPGHMVASSIPTQTAQPQHNNQYHNHNGHQPTTHHHNNNQYHHNNHHHPHHHHHQAHNNRQYCHPYARASPSSPPGFIIPDEGIVPDLDLDRPRKKKGQIRRTGPNREDLSKFNEPSSESRPMTIYKCTWRDETSKNGRCGEIGSTWDMVAEHVLRDHLHGQKTSEDEEDFYIVDEELEVACSPPTKSHWDMVRPRTEDPEYQKQLRLAALPQTQTNSQMTAAINTQDIIIRDVFSISQQQSIPSKHFKVASRPLQSCNTPNISLLTVALGKMPNSPRRVRGDTKKCRKIYGMHQKDLWCTQCKWKKACSRFND
ncbi:zinc finger protein 395 isoform X2 [Copidosoma floridanum]|uniref:zinc finger protein 395 isoform X2 n=1 Tax=Copidosoma floridanum TaxID=29053 RepID=UPI0006C9E215|nr:zinc finger protein 395 isoform X2 [Copidosoma floridanum]